MKIKRLLKKSIVLCYLFALIKVLCNKDSEKLNNTINQFYPKIRKDKFFTIRLKITLQFCRIYYEIAYQEYFLFHFDKLNKKGRKEFLGDKERVRLCNSMTTEETKSIFNVKYNTYTTFKDFFKREIVKISSSEEYDIYLEFINKHKEFIIKPIKSSFGRGIKCIDTSEDSFDEKVFFEESLKAGEFVLEEKIEQIPELAKFHPESCNTVRYSTYIKNGVVYPICSFFRMGQGASIVDNGGAGGIFASIDLETGIIKTPGFTEFGNSFLMHPDTNVQIIGFKIPKWDELVKLAAELAKVVPEQKYVGWDLALTEKGWIVVEGNCRGQFIHQYAENKGYKKYIYSIIETN